MTDTKSLRKHIESKGIKYRVIAEQLNITPFCLQKKIDNLNEFKASEIRTLSQILMLSNKERDAIFLS